MARISFRDGVKFMAKLDKLGASVRQEVLGPAIYAGAEIAADAIRESLAAVPTDERWGSSETPKAGPTAAQKQGMLDSLGIAPLQEDEKGFINVKIGFDGYNAVKSRRWPNGQPNQMVARATESGTSFQQPNPFVKEGMAKARAQVQKAMKETADEKIKEIMGG